ncbi:universal stress protein [Phytohabitans houttuyneae]|jgi:nucleotide-binding universal stress UspA family protein|uniref:Universal stress protein n=1 Tax=Phytohabitans houttuyneae TaxID=1076126 RepID=A0A6V8KI39_9ACTN|nr:universal stress protein [Phytohabitans houttuyneae]GFJ81666.1 universal stress protein [Phytohabitans houttuyneae]
MILAGLGGRGGWQALAWATDEALSSGADLVLLHACPPDSPLASRAPSPSLAIVELFDPSLARAVGTARARLGGDRVRLRLLPGRPGPLLSTAAARADLVVVGPPARRYPGGYGSTTHHVLAHAPAPVVVVRPITAGRDAPLLGHVVVGVDEHDDPGPALEFAFERAADHRCVLAAVHVTSRQREDFWFDETTLSTHFSVEPVALELLGRAVEPWMRRYPQVPVKCAVYGGRPLPGLLRAAHGSRLLVVGDRGRGQLGPAGRALFGSVAHGVVDGANGPVAVVRASAGALPAAAVGSRPEGARL